MYMTYIGGRVPRYALPGTFCRAFHAGSQSIDINFYGLRERSRSARSGEHVKYVTASDMFTILADHVSRRGVVLGFLSQREQFGCIAINDDYDRLKVCQPVHSSS
jgi:hypothetical protein